MPGWSQMAVATSAPPCTTLSTPGRQPRLERQLRERHRRAGILLGRLQDEGVPGGDGEREHEAGEHDREVEGGEAGHHAERLDQGVDVDPARRVVPELPELQAGDAAGVLDDLEPATHLADGVRQGLAVLVGDELGEPLDVVAQELLELQHHPHAGGHRREAPGLEGLLRGGHGEVELLLRRERDPGDHLLGGRVHDVAPLGGLRLDETSADEVLQRRCGHDRSPTSSRRLLRLYLRRRRLRRRPCPAGRPPAPVAPPAGCPASGLIRRPGSPAGRAVPRPIVPGPGVRQPLDADHLGRRRVPRPLRPGAPLPARSIGRPLPLLRVPSRVRLPSPVRPRGATAGTLRSLATGCPLGPRRLGRATGGNEVGGQLAAHEGAPDLPAVALAADAGVERERRTGGRFRGRAGRTSRPGCCARRR